jgi:NAD(P)-dependent dehydrogenase (short-subunit alcohol dehydrogenase family)
MFHLWYFLRRRTPSTFQPVILVTGCSSGIGLALAQMLHAKPQYRVIVTARSIDFLKSKFLDSDRFWVRSLDVTSAEQREALIAEISAAWGGVNILVNNAGISYRAVVEHMTEKDEFLQMSTNYLGPVALIRLVMPHMRKIGRGKIINVSSVSGMLAMPTMASYTASKYALEGMSEALWYEAKPLGINVSLIQPGFVRSKAFTRVYYSEKSKAAAQESAVYGDYYSNMAPFIDRFMKISLSDSGGIARSILKVIRTENPPLWIPSTLDAYVFYYLRRFVPRRILLPLLFQMLPRARKWGRSYSRRRR